MGVQPVAVGRRRGHGASTRLRTNSALCVCVLQLNHRQGLGELRALRAAPVVGVAEAEGPLVRQAALALALALEELRSSVAVEPQEPGGASRRVVVCF
jgi:hypothetical protein